MYPTLTLIRGVSGSGKTTLAKSLVNALPEGTAVHIEADDFFTKNGVYTYDPAKQGVAHMVCLKRARKAMKDQTPNVIVANTFIKRSSLNPYIALAKEFGYEVVKTLANGEYPNIHGVSEEAVQLMKEQFEL